MYFIYAILHTLRTIEWEIKGDLIDNGSKIDNLSELKPVKGESLCDKWIPIPQLMKYMCTLMSQDYKELIEFGKKMKTNYEYPLFEQSGRIAAVVQWRCNFYWKSTASLIPDRQICINEHYRVIYNDKYKLICIATNNPSIGICILLELESFKDQTLSENSFDSYKSANVKDIINYINNIKKSLMLSKKNGTHSSINIPITAEIYTDQCVKNGEYTIKLYTDPIINSSLSEPKIQKDKFELSLHGISFNGQLIIDEYGIHINPKAVNPSKTVNLSKTVNPSIKTVNPSIKTANLSKTVNLSEELNISNTVNSLNTVYPSKKVNSLHTFNIECESDECNSDTPLTVDRPFLLWIEHIDMNIPIICGTI